MLSSCSYQACLSQPWWVTVFLSTTLLRPCIECSVLLPQAVSTGSKLLSISNVHVGYCVFSHLILFREGNPSCINRWFSEHRHVRTEEVKWSLCSFDVKVSIKYPKELLSHQTHTQKKKTHRELIRWQDSRSTEKINCFSMYNNESIKQKLKIQHYVLSLKKESTEKLK